MTEPRRPIHIVNAATGLCFVALGVLLLMQRAGQIELRQIVELWPVVLIVLGGAVALQASRGGETSARGGSCAGGLIWLVVLGFVLTHAFDRRAAAGEVTGPGELSVFAVMTGDRPPGHVGDFRGGKVTTVMGGARIDLTNATMAPGEVAVVDVFNVFAGTEIRVPADWQVDVDATVVAAGVNDQRRRTSDDSGSDDPDAAVAGDEDDAGADQTDGRQASPASATLEAGGDRRGGSPEAQIEAPVRRLVIRGVVLFGGVSIK